MVTVVSPVVANVRCFPTQCEEDQTPKEYFDLWRTDYYGHCGSLCKHEGESQQQMQGKEPGFGAEEALD